jgi:cytochrome c oxidase subunit II
MGQSRRLIPLLVCLGFVASLSGCLPRSPSEQGQDVNALYDFFTAFAVVIFVITCGLIGWSMIRYRKKPGDEELPPQFHSNLPLEITWFAIPQVIVIVLFVVSVIGLNNVNHISPDPDLTVKVTGFQWGWNFHYEGSDVTLHSTPQDEATMYLPVDKDILFRITSQDVIHSFYVPQLLTKRDAIPGNINEVPMNITEPGTFDGHCAEFCGNLHSRMDFEVKAVPAARFEAWLSQQQQGGG